jgi:hypothetical protein
VLAAVRSSLPHPVAMRQAAVNALRSRHCLTSGRSRNDVSVTACPTIDARAVVKSAGLRLIVTAQNRHEVLRIAEQPYDVEFMDTDEVEPSIWVALDSPGPQTLPMTGEPSPGVCSIDLSAVRAASRKRALSSSPPAARY